MGWGLALVVVCGIGGGLVAGDRGGEAGGGLDGGSVGGVEARVGFDLAQDAPCGVETGGLEVLLGEPERGFEAGVCEKPGPDDRFVVAPCEIGVGLGLLLLAVGCQQFRAADDRLVDRVADGAEEIGVTLGLEEPVALERQERLERACGFVEAAGADEFIELGERFGGAGGVIDIGRVGGRGDGELGAGGLGYQRQQAGGEGGVEHASGAFGVRWAGLWVCSPYRHHWSLSGDCTRLLWGALRV